MSRIGTNRPIGLLKRRRRRLEPAASGLEARKVGNSPRFMLYQVCDAVLPAALTPQDCGL